MQLASRPSREVTQILHLLRRHIGDLLTKPSRLLCKQSQASGDARWESGGHHMRHTRTDAVSPSNRRAVIPKRPQSSSHTRLDRSCALSLHSWQALGITHRGQGRHRGIESAGMACMPRGALQGTDRARIARLPCFLTEAERLGGRIRPVIRDKHF